ncbi:MAG: sigma 54-interacting transcriptional regulator, partial [Myxococcales bacterium]|nr:sigma 54-interacting transcriptional regulator [Myxococcales bacterium]
MPTLVFETASGSRETYQIFKKITTFGSSADNDLYLDADDIAPHHGHITFNGKTFVISSLEKGFDVLVNGRKRRNYKLSNGDRIDIGSMQLVFSLFDDVEIPSSETIEEIDYFEKLYEFSERLMRESDINKLLETLIDLVVRLTQADRGFLILMDSGEPSIVIARSMNRETILDADSRISDSIVQKVVETRESVIVSDALNDREFSSSLSVVNLKLCSVMCVPMLDRGHLLGVLYLGNDNVVNLFKEESLERLTIFAAQASLILRNALALNALKLDNRELKKTVEEQRFGSIIGSCEAISDIFDKVRKIASTDISVLIQGETGTGKELIAREIHLRSNRAKGPFVTINCGAIPENLLESELFGHVRGAFTGAVSTVNGKFQVANGGTLFLDEIGEMPLNLQVKLLRAIQEKSVQKVGATKGESVDIRIVAATNRDLSEEIRSGRFREDLFYRLNVVGLNLPPLRDRGEDLVLIARFLLNKFATEYNAKARGFTTDAVIAMRKNPWPGNIREL